MTVAEPVATTGTATASAAGPAPERVARLSYFFPAHNEEANLEGLVEEALEVLPTLAETFEIIAVNDGSKDRTREIADDLAARYPDVVRAVHHPTNYGYGAALRSGFAASRYELIAFTDGDRQFKVVDLGRLTTRLAQADRPGRRRRLSDQARRSVRPDALRPRLPAREPAVLRAEGHRRRLRGQALPARGARGHPRGVGRGVLLGRAAHQAAGGRAKRRRGRRPALLANGRLGHRRQALGHPAGRARLLAAPARTPG